MGATNIPQINATNDYSLFTVLDGNRSVSDGRKEKIKKSIENVGYIPSPIVVNEKMQVIDGQGRLAACEDLGLPVFYVVIPGLTIEHCIAMNIYQKKWSLMDYVDSYASRGKWDYIFLKEMMKQFEALGTYTIIACVLDAFGGSNTSIIKAGAMKIDKNRIGVIKANLEWIQSEISPIKECLSGRVDTFCAAIHFVLEHTNANRTRLSKVLREHARDISPIANVAQAVKEIERIYNRGLSTSKIYFYAEYDKHATMKKMMYSRSYRENASR